jgi:hypothetical protein
MRFGTSASFEPIRWALRGFAASLVANLCLAVFGAFNVNLELSSTLLPLTISVNFAGIPLMLLFGAVSMGEAQHTSLDTWNALLLCSGGVVFWTMVGAMIGYFVGDKAANSVTAAAEPRSGDMPAATGNRGVDRPDQSPSD